MNTIQDVLIYVQKKILEITPPGKESTIQSFLESLVNSTDLNSNRLLICMGIDLKTYERLGVAQNSCKTLSQLFKDIILSISPVKPALKSFKSGITPAIEFSMALKNFTIQQCLPHIKATGAEKYFRITSFKNFIDWVVKYNTEVNPDIPEDIDSNEINRYYDEFTKQGKFSNIYIANLGSGTGWVFIGSYTDLESEINSKKLSYLIDSLGFYISNIQIDDFYISMNYPDDFKKNTFQPNTLNGDWGVINSTRTSVGNEFFLSYYKKDDWGRTHSVSGTYSGIKERIHVKLEFPHFTPQLFEIKDLGGMTAQISSGSLANVINEALTRYSNA